jgi:hypothetical protein
MLSSSNKMAQAVVVSYRNRSIARVAELAEGKELKAQIESSSLTGFFGVHNKRFPTMYHALGNTDIYHATPVTWSNNGILPFDCQYIKCIPVANGPYAGDSNSGDQISGNEWFEELSDDLQERVADSHLKLCLQPAWMLSDAALIAVPRHLKRKDVHSRWLYAGTSAVGSLYFHRFKEKREEYIALQRHAIFNIPRDLSKLLCVTCVGDNTTGCDQLGKTFLPVPLNTV